MAPRAAQVSDDEIERVVWKMVRTADLQKLTPKLIRGHLLDELGAERLQRGDGDLKKLVKGMIPAMVARRMAGDGADGGEDGEGGGEDGDGDGESREQQLSDDGPAEKAPVSAAPAEAAGGSPRKSAAAAGGRKGSRLKKRKVEESSSGEGEDGSIANGGEDTAEEKAFTPQRKKGARAASASPAFSPKGKKGSPGASAAPASDEGGMSSDDSDHPPRRKAVKRAPQGKKGARAASASPAFSRKGKKGSPAASAAPASDEGGMSSDDSDRPPRRKAVKRKRAPKAEVRRGPSGPKLTKILKVARELGYRIPPTVLRGKSGDEEKLLACRAYLGKNGVEGDVLKLRVAEIAELREKLDREKELRELDAGNVIGDVGSRRRTRGKARVPTPEKGSDSGDSDGSRSSGESGSSVESSDSEFVINTQ